jgi:sulfur carrier protein
MSEATITVNGEPLPLEEASLGSLLVRLGYDGKARGVAVARNGKVVPRSGWAAEPVQDGDVVEIVGAVQGG